MIENDKFNQAHSAFLFYVTEQTGGIPFSSFEHPYLIDEEIAYKWAAYDDARKILNTSNWNSWQKRPGEIIKVMQEACQTRVSRNLLEQRYGGSQKSLFRIEDKGKAKIQEYESILFSLFDISERDAFEVTFDQFADFLRTEKLGCNWAYVAYVSFLANPQLCFPIRPERFDLLLDFYGVNKQISGYVSWERYHILLDLADTLRRKNLSLYGNADAIEIQSYMWVVSRLIKNEFVNDFPANLVTVDYQVELERRQKRVSEKERIGLLGEQHVLEKESQRLIDLGRNDLAGRVILMSAVDSSRGFDILSFKENGTPLHIEVKTTTRSRRDDNGFWLPDSERSVAQEDPYWTLYRVWNIDKQAEYDKLGNIVTDPNAGWTLSASNWFAKPLTLID